MLQTLLDCLFVYKYILLWSIQQTRQNLDLPDNSLSGVIMNIGLDSIVESSVIHFP